MYLIVAILQAQDGQDSGYKTSFVHVYNTYIPYDSQLCMGEYKAHACKLGS